MDYAALEGLKISRQSLRNILKIYFHVAIFPLKSNPARSRVDEN
jgi:hypothetical protein